MKSGIVKLIALFSLALAVFASCSKEPLLPKPTPTPTPGNPESSPTGKIVFAVNQTLTGAPYHSSNLTAVVTIVNNNNQVVANEKILTLDLNGTVKSENVELPAGTYKLTRFRLVYGSVNTHFAAPLAGSIKAAGVQKPLPFEFMVTVANSVVPVDVVKVATSEGPQQFGYPAGSFDNHQEENNPFLKVKIKAIMQIGDVLYDSIPASLVLTTWNSQGEMSTTYHQLKAGVNELQVMKAASKYRFHVSRWGATDEMTLERQQVDANTVYVLGGSKAAKKLKSERTEALVNGQYVPESKTDYAYDINGRLFRVYHYLRNGENRPYLFMAEHFQYNGNHLEKISRFDEKNALMGSTSFTYDQQGKVRSMEHLESGQITTATVNYLYNPIPEATIHYTYNDQTYAMDHNMFLYGGNIQSSTTYVDRQLSSNSRYEYDFGINPYVHMNWPDIYFSKFSKNNVIRQTNSYYIHMPLAEPYEFSYTYDADGYPKELVKKFRSLPNKQHTKTTKTIFEY